MKRHINRLEKIEVIMKKHEKIFVPIMGEEYDLLEFKDPDVEYFIIRVVDV